MSKLLDSLNEQQKKAVTINTPHILCNAGAGSGKTTVLTRRIAYLNQEHRVGTSNMLALTFTRLAGREMKERVMQLIGEREGRKLFCNTFHAFCVRVLKEWGHIMDYEKDFTIYDTEDRLNVIKNIINELGYKIKPDEVIKAMEYEYSGIVVLDAQGAIKEYYYRLKKNNALDLDMLLTQTLKLMCYKMVRNYYQDQYKYVFVDEFQDTDNLQWSIIQCLNPENLFIVGDDFQSIYGWRGANVQNFINLAEDEHFEVINLERNYRSPVAIIEASNCLISHNNNQAEKRLWTDKEGSKVEVMQLLDEQTEANRIAAMILEHTGKYSDIAVLARTNRQLEFIYDTFKKFEIPSQLVSGKKDILKNYDIKKIFNYMDIINNSDDDFTLKRIINWPVRRLSDMEIQKCELIAIDKNISLHKAINQLNDALRPYRPDLDNFISIFDKLGKAAANESDKASYMFNKVLESVGIKEHYMRNRLTNKLNSLDEALKAVRHWERTQYKMGESVDFTSFLKWLRIKDIQDKLLMENNTVKLMTVHGAKGLEFNTVFLAGMNQDVFPSKRAEDMEEERRLCYVAVTRAKEKLILTRPLERILYRNHTVMMDPSQFIKELGIA